MKRRVRRLRAAVQQIDRAASPAGAKRRKLRVLKRALREQLRSLRRWYARALFGADPSPRVGHWIAKL